MCFCRLTALAAVAAAAQLPCGATAQNGPNLLVNGGFDAGLTGYAAFASPGYIVSAVLDCNLGVTCALFGTPGTGPGFATLSQTVATTPGTSYLASITTGQKASGAAFSFFLDAGAGPTSFECLASPSCVVTQALTATGASTTVTFGVEGFTPPGGDRFGPSGIVVDNASLIAVSAVPEPAAWSALCVGLLALGTAWRRRAAAARLQTVVRNGRVARAAGL
jgi:hypothetical protein